MSYLEELLPEFRKGARIRRKCWPENLYISLKGCSGLNIAFYDVDADDWEVVPNNSIDWNYVIKNKCLCWFWDNNFNWAVCGTLGKIEKCAACKFIMFDDSGNRSPYVNCRPVRRDEVSFYEDRKE